MILVAHSQQMPPNRSNTRSRTLGGTGSSSSLPIHSGILRLILFALVISVGPFRTHQRGADNGADGAADDQADAYAAEKFHDHLAFSSTGTAPSAATAR